MDLYTQIEETRQWLEKNIEIKPKWGIILGSGLGGLVRLIENAQRIEYTDIPHFKTSSVKGHQGALIFGQLEGVDVVLMAGRLHYYEGHSMKEVTYPVRVMKALGCHSVAVSNAAGGVQEGMRVGDLMIINDHINATPESPLRGVNDDRLGPRFPEMIEPYDREYINTVQGIAKEESINVKEGVYYGLSGPTFETPAEYRMIYRLGGDAVGMSTVPEVVVARHGGMRVFGLSVITDIGYPPENVEHVDHEYVLKAAQEAGYRVETLFRGLIRIHG